METIAMTSLLRNAQGATAFTELDGSWFDPLEQEPDSHWAEDHAREQWNNLFDKLLAMRSWQDGWDGAGAVAPGAQLIDQALQWAILFARRNLPPPSRIFPSDNGTIYFEWHDPQAYYEFEVLSPAGEAEWRRIRQGRCDIWRVGAARQQAQ